MAEFILKDWHGKEKTYDHDTIYVRDKNGYLMPFTHGSAGSGGLHITDDGEGNVFIDTNGSVAITDDGNGNVVIAHSGAVLEPLEVTENGIYTPSNGVDGFNSVTVNVGASGSVGSDDLKYVTFKSYDGSVEYGKKAVAKGDDCADPIARGVFTTPTREADAQYTYTFYGWATEPNGGADANWNKSIEADKTVYANFSKAVRSYTITFYDEDGTTVLKTQSLAYGTTPSYTPTKAGAVFSGWSPALATVTGDASYTASWDEAVTFADMTWARIAEISEAGLASNYFAIGDTRTEKLGSIGTVKMMIIGFNHDDKADGSGKAGITIGMVDASTYNVKCGQNYYGFSMDGDPLKNRCDEHYGGLSSDLKNVMKSVTKKSTQWKDGAMSTYTFDASLWLFSFAELGLTIGYSWNINDGSQKYKAVTDGLFTPGVSKEYWLRNQSNTLGYAMGCSTTGMLCTRSSTLNGYWMRYGFCI